MDIYRIYENEKTICQVVVFEDNKCVVYWFGEINSIVIHDNLENFRKISLNDNRKIVHLQSIENSIDSN